MSLVFAANSILPCRPQTSQLSGSRQWVSGFPLIPLPTRTATYTWGIWSLMSQIWTSDDLGRSLRAERQAPESLWQSPHSGQNTNSSRVRVFRVFWPFCPGSLWGPSASTGALLQLKLLRRSSGSRVGTCSHPVYYGCRIPQV